MQVTLNQLQRNPLRDFDVDPIDQEVIERLRTSIKQDGFWGGVVCRKRNGHIEVIAGHHRIEAAKLEGITRADLFVTAKMDDEAAIRIYASENALQRGGETATAGTGAVASALRFLMKREFGEISPNSKSGPRFEPGKRRIAEFLGIKESVAQERLANLKASGDYARIIAEVQKEIEEEKGPKNALIVGRIHARAKDKPVTFDFRGVSKHLKSEHQIRVFREMVEGPGIREKLSVDKQEELAEWLKTKAENDYNERRRKHKEVTAEFIRDNINEQVLSANTAITQKFKKQKEQALREATIQTQFKYEVHCFCRTLNSLTKYGSRIEELIKQNPEIGFKGIPPELRNSLVSAHTLITSLKERIG